MNLAATLLGPLYDLYIAALGESVGIIVSYVTLLGLASLIWWGFANRNDIISGFDLRGATIGNMVLLFLLTFVIYFVAFDYLGFPMIGSLTVAVSSTLLFHWTISTLEGEPV
ncbi:MAG TPA: hypothetical protein HA340_03555 [Candidatus Thalassarchaeaceae archaeon]|jgi:hypothetical protein|nr:hypothetical protein [Euryarchaeota archaeon]DAC50499.1 MAG TPA: hypothetical protein D7H97_03510 [Candidatus Poseidoniales archaeon]HIH83003.1 hypothetical protein [Candidatus Thalassarchaeaceae archaeon]|tara:strand:+ start:1059 stop:1394 length:336 start_codon:yes stop_codon:yes gene_type:complete